MAELDELVFECLEGLEGRGRAVIDEVCAAHPALADALRKRLRALSEIGLLEPRDAFVGSRPPERLGEFRLIERLGGGGMGIVYLAEQERIGRRVALKLIRPDQLFFAGARERFAREIETVARLQHPGIVPIHAVGEESGVPYFAMQLVEGCTLDAALEELEGRDPRKLTGRDFAHAIARRTGSTASATSLHESDAYVFSGSWEAACLEIVRQVADALTHAHSRGVLHRDIKPSNVMITPAGRAMLVDFGLASMEGATKLTRSGSQLGSVPYMSPEQTVGRYDTIDARSDVYSLGVTLFELLTLHHPFRDESTPGVLLSIQGGVRERARTLNPQLSWEAETVCHTALEVDRDRRYAKAADFARDLQNALERRPIEARPVSGLRRAWRWAQRRPAAAIAVTLAVLLAIGGPTTFALQQRAANRRVASQRDRAEANLDHALEAIRRMFTNVSAVELRDIPQLDPMRQQLVEGALELLDALGRQNATPELRRTIARTEVVLGGLLRQTGNLEQALEPLQESEQILEGLMTEDPADHESCLVLGRNLLEQGRIQLELGALDTGVAALERAVECIAVLQEAGGVDPLMNSTKGQARIGLGRALREQGDYEAAAAHFEAGITALELALLDLPDDVEILKAMTRSHSGIGSIHLLKGELVEAAASFEEALMVGAQVDSQLPGTAAGTGIAAAALNLGFVRTAQGDFDAAEANLMKAATVLEGLIEAYPQQFHHRVELGKVKSGLLEIALLRNDFEQAELIAEDAVGWSEQLTLEHPEHMIARSLFANMLHCLGMARSALERDLDQTIELLEMAIENQLLAQELTPASEQVRSRLVDHYFILGMLLAQPEAADRHSRSYDVLLALLESCGDDLEAFTFAATGLARCAQAVAADQDLDPDERMALEREYIEAAAGSLCVAIEYGHESAVRKLLTESPLCDMVSDPAFEILRD